MNPFTLLLLSLFFFYRRYTALNIITQPNDPLPVRKTYQFPRPVWIENIAVRFNNDLLLTRLDAPELWLLNFESPDPDPVLIHSFPFALAVTGIVEIAPDVFAVSVGNYTLATGPFRRSWAVYRVDLNGWNSNTSSPVGTSPLGAVQVTKIADIPSAVYLKGMALLSERYILMSDMRSGRIYRLDLLRGQHAILVSDSLMAAVPQSIFGPSGINGLHVRDSHLYFTNTGQNILAKQPIHPHGTAAGPASVIAHTTSPTDYFDGFTFGPQGDVYIGTGSGNTVVRLTQSGEGPAVLVVGGLDSLLVPEPTNFAFGRGDYEGVLYVATAGAQAAPVQGRYLTGGSVVALEVVMGSPQG